VEGEAMLVAADAVLPSVSDEGTLTYVSGVRSTDRQLFWVDRGGRVGAPVGQLHKGIRHPALSPDGRRVAIMGDDGNRDVWVYDLDRNTRTRLTRGEFIDGDPAWSPSSGEVVYSTSPDARAWNIEVRRADGSGEAHVMVAGPAGNLTWSQRGDYLLYETPGPGRDGDIEGVPIDEAGETGPAAVRGHRDG
jgi:Tol biopolymer transport system component